MKTATSFFIVAGAVVALAPLQASHAQSFPTQNIQIVITLTPGDTGDMSARAVGAELGKVLKTAVIPVNKTGASGAVGADAVVKSKKDGHTLLYINSNLTYAYAANPEATPYNPFTDLEPLATATSVPLFIAVQSDSPWKSIRELIAFGKLNPGKLRGSSTGTGSVGHFGYEIIRVETGAAIDNIPYKGAAPGMAALLGGHVEVAIPSPTIAMPHAKAGKIRLLVASRKVQAYPDVPTLTQLGYKRDMSSVWFGFFLPTGVPEPVKKVLAASLEKAIKSPEASKTFHSLGTEMDYRPAAEFKKMMLDEYGMVKAMLKTAPKTK
jgi:tripartite-type tricarboxylate transporter receptor subunit TctC